jgi:hypothetical protein
MQVCNCCRNATELSDIEVYPSRQVKKMFEFGGNMNLRDLKLLMKE